MKSVGFILLVALLIGSNVPVGAQTDEPELPSASIHIMVPELYLAEERLSGPGWFEAGTTLRSDAAGVGVITWLNDGTESVLGPESTLRLNTFTDESPFEIDLELSQGRLVSGLGSDAEGIWRLNTPEFALNLIAGQFEVIVGTGVLLIVTEGQVEITTEGEPLVITENHFITAAPGEGISEPQTLSDDGITVNLSEVCTATANANINVRLAPNENSRRLMGIPSGQALWVRAGTYGNLWLQVYVQTPDDDEEAHNFGWIYGPATTLDPLTCASILRAPLDARLYGGPGMGSIPAE
jgi:hypothetical protein